MNHTTHISQAELPVLGVDVGRVIISPGSGPDDTSFFGHDLEAAMRTPAMPECFSALARLVAAFQGRVWIVSKAGPKVAQRTLAWFEAHAFFKQTGISQSHVIFCRERADKRIHCERHSITHFVDDRADVLFHLKGLVPNRYQMSAFARLANDPDVQPVGDWTEALRRILVSLRRP